MADIGVIGVGGADDAEIVARRSVSHDLSLPRDELDQSFSRDEALVGLDVEEEALAAGGEPDVMVGLDLLPEEPPLRIAALVINVDG